MDKFWMLFGPGESNSTRRYATYEEAKAEAECLVKSRLCRDDVYILEVKTVGHFSAQMQWEEE